MNPDTKPENQFNLPPPIAQAPAAPSAESALPPVEQSLAPSPEAAGNQQQPPALSVLPPDDATQAASLPFSQPAPQAAAPAPLAATQAASASEDALTKEMVQKAKNIVLHTALDPFEQNKQLAAVKAEFLQKRYGKVLKVAE